MNWLKKIKKEFIILGHIIRNVIKDPEIPIIGFLIFIALPVTLSMLFETPNTKEILKTLLKSIIVWGAIGYIIIRSGHKKFCLICGKENNKK